MKYLVEARDVEMNNVIHSYDNTANTAKIANSALLYLSSDDDEYTYTVNRHTKKNMNVESSVEKVLSEVEDKNVVIMVPVEREVLINDMVGSIQISPSILTNDQVKRYLNDAIVTDLWNQLVSVQSFTMK
jgi:hypothetical protein